jgi:hypothetical protein
VNGNSRKVGIKECGGEEFYIKKSGRNPYWKPRLFMN